MRRAGDRRLPAARREEHELDVRQNHTDQPAQQRYEPFLGRGLVSERPRRPEGDAAADEGRQDHSETISRYLAVAGWPPIASPTPTTAPVTVNAVAMGYPVKIPMATSTAAVMRRR